MKVDRIRESWLERSQRALDIQRVLETELSRLTDLIPCDEVLSVRWRPCAEHYLSGEVVGRRIYIHDMTLPAAINTLRHEYLDTLLTRKIVEPLTAMINSLIQLQAKKVYHDKEILVNNFAKLLSTEEEC